MSYRSIPITLLTGAPREAEEMKRRMAKILDKPISLQTHYSADEFEESSSPPVFMDELDEHRDALRKDSWVGKALIYLIATCAGFGLLAFLFNRYLP